MIVAFDIETIPDIQSGRSLYDLEGIGDAEVAKAMLAIRRTKVPDAVMLPLHLHRVISISVAVRWEQNKFIIQSLGNSDGDEKPLVQEFFRSLEKQPKLVSWNGSGFDLPVLQYRALYHAIASKPYWDTGEFKNEYKFNNYQSRYHKRHIDLMDLLSRYQMKVAASLNEISKLIGLPGKVGIGGEHVFETYLDGKLQAIRDYCEIDALNTYLVYLRFEFIRGNFTAKQYDDELRIVRNWLKESGKEHLLSFEKDWPE